MRSLIRKNNLELRGKKVLILGSGGTSKTAYAVARSLEASEIICVSRSGRNGAVTYDEIDVYKRQSYGSSNYGGFASGSGGAGTNADFVKVRSLINNGRYSEAEIILDGYSSSDRGAEWNYLKGQVLMQRGWYFEAQRFFETACYMACLLYTSRCV